MHTFAIIITKCNKHLALLDLNSNNSLILNDAFNLANVINASSLVVVAMNPFMSNGINWGVIYEW